jgi:hypothetical protein
MTQAPSIVLPLTIETTNIYLVAPSEPTGPNVPPVRANKILIPLPTPSLRCILVLYAFFVPSIHNHYQFYPKRRLIFLSDFLLTITWARTASDHHAVDRCMTPLSDYYAHTGVGKRYSRLGADSHPHYADTSSDGRDRAT